jgi:hypothetical protein
MREHDYFVVNGYERACAGIEAQVRLEVEVEFAERLAAASFWERLLFKRLMEGEVRHGVRERIASQRISPDALY